MATHTYKYPYGSWIVKSILWIFITLLVVSILFDVLGALGNIVDGKAKEADYLQLAAALVLGVVFISYAANLYPNIEEGDQGLKVEFFAAHLFVPWENMLRIKQGGSVGYKTWTVEVKRGLTPIHRIYGLIYLRTLRPAFLVFATLPDHEDLIEEIKKHLGQ